MSELGFKGCVGVHQADEAVEKHPCFWKVLRAQGMGVGGTGYEAGGISRARSWALHVGPMRLGSALESCCKDLSRGVTQICNLQNGSLKVRPSDQRLDSGLEKTQACPQGAPRLVEDARVACVPWEGGNIAPCTDEEL